MKKFACQECDRKWYSSSDGDKICQSCGGKLEEVEIEGEKDTRIPLR
jgi:rRNA maturation endonuclease Nob1